MAKTKVIEFILTMGDGGAETLVKDYALLMDREQLEVTVVVMHDIADSANLQRLKDHGISVIALSSEDSLLKKIWRRIFWKRDQQVVDSEMIKETPVLPGTMEEGTGWIHTLRHYLRNLYFGLRFVKIVRQTGASVVHGHLEVLYCLKTVSWLLKDIRLVHTCHALPELVYEGREEQAARYLIRNNNLHLVALHEDMANQMNAMFPEQRTTVIRNGINLDVFRNPGISKAEKRRELSIPEDAFLVGHVGRFTPEKNHPFLVEVFQEIVKKKENAYLLMIGAEDHSHIEKQLADAGLSERYQILSGRKDIHELLSAMDVFVFPSIFEGFGIALLEAQAAGLRCVASEKCPEDAVRTKHCMVLPLEEPSNWAKVALDAGLFRTPERTLDDYDMKKEIRRLEQLYLGQLDA